MGQGHVLLFRDLVSAELGSEELDSNELSSKNTVSENLSSSPRQERYGSRIPRDERVRVTWARETTVRELKSSGAQG